MRISFNKITACLGVFAIFLTLTSCDRGPGPDLGDANDQQIFESWRLNEVIRKGCDDANNNLRRACTECTLLVLNTDNTFQVIGEEDELLAQGNFRVVDDEEIIFDPGIFNNSNVRNARYSLIRGALKFDYQDGTLDCAVTESYVVNNNSIAGD